ncbi:MAG: hypothetical protein IPL26_07340 [Leptospiraceae bacterium]|nr:hypothetical protein [Leptospiraceae bacterium]
MVITDTIEGIINNLIWFHYDLLNDVLYIRKKDFLKKDTFSEQRNDGILVITASDSETPVGYTVVNWWKKSEKKEIPDSLKEITSLIESYTIRLLTA